MDEADVPVAGVMGTSAGALAGALYCAGFTPSQVAEELTRDPPLLLLRPCLQPWRGGFLSLHRVIARLEELLPPTFDQLQREFAVGVVGRDGVYRVVDKGPLAPAVVASAAIPILFANVDIDGVPGGPFKDGGVVDRIGIAGWRTRRRQQRRGIAAAVAPPPAVVHLITRSSPLSGRDDIEAMGERRVTVVRSPKSGVSLWSLGDVEGQFGAAKARAQQAAESVMDRQRRKVAEPGASSTAA